MLDCQINTTITAEPKPKPKFVGFNEQLSLLRIKKEQSNAGDPWLTRKFAVGLVIAIFGWTYYVFVVRLCVEMIKREGGSLGTKGMGVALITIYHILFCMFVWCYYVAITTSPGYASDYVPQTDPPKEEDAPYVQVTVAGNRFEDQQERPSESSEPARRSLEQGPPLPAATVTEMEETTEKVAEEHPITCSIPTGNAASTTDDSSLPQAPAPAASSTSIRRPSTSGTTTSHTPLHRPAASSPPPPRLSRSSTLRSFLHFPPPPDSYEPAKNIFVIERIPPSVPVLSENYRYDGREGILRPGRSHRCRHCARVVLKMDHHCPWVGSCVGARNYKYFYNFLQSSTLFTTFLFLSLLIANARPYFLPTPRPRVDPQQLAVLVLAFLFTFFTLSLFLAHTRLIILNLTTIEDMALSRMKARERSAIGSVYKLLDRKGPKEVRERWDKEWGRLGKEGNLWWLGSKKKNWEMVMGEEKWGWFLPIPAKPHMDDGLSYVPNPRFNKDGIWRRRREWPRELQ